LGEVWWSLANLKTVKFDDADRAAMLEQLTRTDLSEEDRFHLDFALGKAFEDLGDYAQSFAHYASGNALRKKGLSYDPEEMSQHLRRSKALFTPAFFAARPDHAALSPDPISSWACPGRAPP